MHLFRIGNWFSLYALTGYQFRFIFKQKILLSERLRHYEHHTWYPNEGDQYYIYDYSYNPTSDFTLRKHVIGAATIGVNLRLFPESRVQLELGFYRVLPRITELSYIEKAPPSTGDYSSQTQAYFQPRWQVQTQVVFRLK